MKGTSMRRVIGILLMGLLIALPSGAATNLYKMRNGATVTTMGLELINLTNAMCNAFSQIELHHFNGMTQQRNDADDYTTVRDQWGVIDPSDNSACESCAEAMFNELNSFMGNAGPSLRQWCSRIKQ
jgi:hypothetical protein